MVLGWEALESWGVPLGGVRPPPTHLEPRAVRAAIAVVMAAGPPEAAQLDALRAWLVAFRDHWPARFAQTFGEDGERFLAECGDPPDANRHVKLRRIAIDNLARAL